MRNDLTPADRHRLATELYQKCLALKDGETQRNPNQQITKVPVTWDFDIHRYEKHGWLLYWHSPKESRNIGIKLSTPQLLMMACHNNFGPEMNKHLISAS